MSLPVISCPAGERIHPGNRRGCRCHIEHSNVVNVHRGDVVSSLEAFCEGDYTQCSTWREEKKRTSAAPLVDPREEHASRRESLDEKLQRAASVRA